MTTLTTFVSTNDRQRPGVRAAVRSVQVFTLILLLLIGIGPLYWMVKGAVSPPTELTTAPLALWPDRPTLGNFATAYTDLSVGRYLMNTFLVVGGSWFVQLFVSATAGFALSVLRPKFGKVVYGAILATMFVPYTVNMVSLFMTVIDVPFLHLNLGDTYWAIWLPRRRTPSRCCSPSSSSTPCRRSCSTRRGSTGPVPGNCSPRSCCP